MLTRRDQLKLKQDQDVEKKKGKGKGDDGSAEVPKAKPKSKGQRAGKGKGKAKSKSKTTGDEKPLEEQDGVSPFKTPKRKLFPEDDGFGENLGDEHDPVMKAQKTKEDPATKMVVDPKTGEQKSLAQLFEEYLPSAWKRNMKSSRDPRNGTIPTDVPDEETKPTRKGRAKAKAGAKAKASPKAKAKGKAKAKAKVASSPSVKKEQARRRKKQEEEIKEQPENMKDDLLLDVFREHIGKMKDDSISDDDLKSYFREGYFKGYKGMFIFSCYWEKQAVGLVFSGGSHFAYFSFCNKRAPWKFNMTLACTCAYMMVSFKHLDVFCFNPQPVYLQFVFDDFIL